ncbi:MAG: hypothetical protein ACRD8A_11385 [Candidatus Acidiferrales bacterium]
MPESFADVWKKFHDRLQLANEHLAAEMAAAVADIRILTERVRDQLAVTTPDQLDPGNVDSFERLFGELENHLFSDPMGIFEKVGPIGRALSAIEQHQLEMNDLARGLPAEITISGAELIQMIGPDVSSGWRRTWAKWHRPPRPLRLREIVLTHLWGRVDRRASIDGAFELVLVRTGLHLVAAWQVYRRHQLARLASASRGEKALAREGKWWLGTATVLTGRAEHLVQSYRRWFDASPARVGDAVLRRSPELSERHRHKISERWQTDFTNWHRQQRAVHAVIDLERQLSIVARDAAQATRRALESLRAENDDVTEEMDRAVAWIEAGVERRNREGFPPPKASLLSAEQRTRDWSDRISSSTHIFVPAFVEVVHPDRAFLRWRKPWRQLHPQRILLQALQHAGLDPAREGFREAETENTAIVRDIEHARQVVAFALEAGQSEGETVHKLPREAAANALALLQHRREILLDPQPAAESGLCHSQALIFLQTHTALEMGRLGLLALLTREGGPRVVRNLGSLALDTIRAGSRGSRTMLGNILQWASWKLGLERPVAPRFQPVVEQPRLSAILEIQTRTRQLPALYKRLFRLAPVEDQRFLVGREIEMRGLRQAFSLWQSGHSMNVVIVGARGSGKTSLLNCASSVAFTGVPVVRGQFGPRILGSDQMSEFLRELFGISASADLTAALSQGRRVAVIEELERTFLRCMNGFDILRDFLQLITATSGSTLWILSLNQASFGYLDAVSSLGRNFSHRINAMAVTQEQMVKAILQRHTLSGLRLQFAPAPPGDPRVKRLRRFFGLELTPQQMFFDALYRQSEGLFRSAFELWLGSIERIEGSVVHMLQPLDPNYSGLDAELKSDDFFTLQAILQHASVTEDELAEVFSTSIEEARCRLERLVALEILEPEPASPGLRVRPQAGRFVRDALNEKNLL